MWYHVLNEDGQIIECRIVGKLKLKGIKSTNPLAVGDRVIFKPEGADKGLITSFEKRDNYIIRRSTNLSKQTHIIAANIDQAFLLVTMTEPFTTTGFIDRFLVSAEAYHIPTILLFNKLDEHNQKADDRLAEYLQIYDQAGYECLQMSALKKINVDTISRRMKGKTTLLAGHSGVGKSTFANAIQPGLKLKTAEVSQLYKQGKHTTTFAEMFPLNMGGYLIDTPGIKSFGVYDIDRNEISHYFPEMLKYISACKFNDCLHISEPNCAVRAAYDEGEIAHSRYKNYLEIINDDDGPYRVDIYA